MTEFDSRTKAFEKKFELDEELKFKITTRAAKLVGLWAASQMGLKGTEAEAYAQSAIDADMTLPGHEDLIGKIEKDFVAKGVAQNRHQINREWNTALETAREQLAKGA